jgi:hypothetical protein
MEGRAGAKLGRWLGLAGLLLGSGACADDTGLGSDGTATASSGSSSSSSSSITADVTTSGPGVTSMATSADTTAGDTSSGGTSSGGTTAALDDTSSGGTTRGDSSSGGTSSGGGSTTTTGGNPSCGNAVVDAGEQCDSDELQGFDCASLGLGAGDLQCDPVMCTCDTSMCMPGGGTSG